MDGGSVTEIAVSGVTDFAALGARWRDLETRADGSFFQSWTWTGCLASERFPDPVLVEAREGGVTVALALFNRRGSTLFLGESGDPLMDGIYIEHNGVLTERGREAPLGAACLAAARRGGRRLMLSGVSDVPDGIGLVRHRQSHESPFVEITGNKDDFINSRSANTRQQLRRSDRGYAAAHEIGVLAAENLAQAYEFLDGLRVLHQTAWVARGRPGAFANPFFQRFHRALIERGLARGEIDLLRIAAGGQPIGYLYNFRYNGASLAYQSGFDYAAAGRHGKPGLTCHHQAIRRASGLGLARYEFLAGGGRYKRSLSDDAGMLHWVEVGSPWSPRMIAARILDWIRGRRALENKVKISNYIHEITFSFPRPYVIPEAFEGTGAAFPASRLKNKWHDIIWYGTVLCILIGCEP